MYIYYQIMEKVLNIARDQYLVKTHIPSSVKYTGDELNSEKKLSYSVSSVCIRKQLEYKYPSLCWKGVNFYVNYSVEIKGPFIYRTQC